MMDLEQRFWQKVDFAGPIPEKRPDLGPCWLWTGARQSQGYGSFCVNRKSMQAHQFAYELLIGPIPPKRLPHHLCKNKGCANPYHLEIVTQSEHNRRHGIGMNLPKKEKVRVLGGECSYGHKLEGDNAYKAPDGEVRCRKCACQWRRDYIERKRKEGIAVAGTAEHYRAKRKQKVAA